MAIRATRTFQKHATDLEELDEDPDLLNNPNFRFTATVEESKVINRISGGAIILAASGMCEAGRIRHHLRHWLWKPKTTVLIVGYQAEGTLGRLLIDGREDVRIQGHHIKVAARIRQIETYSGHADRTELKEWLLHRRAITRAIFLVHGEEPEALAMQDILEGAELGGAAVLIPMLDDEVELVVDREPISLKPKQVRISPNELTGLDWHNDLAQFQIDVREAFEKAADKRSRNILMQRLRRALENN